MLPKCHDCRRRWRASKPRNGKPVNMPTRPRTSSRLWSPRPGKMPRSLDDSARPSTLLDALESEQKSKEEAEGLAAALAGDVGVLQREKTVLKEQVNGEAQVTFLL